MGRYDEIFEDTTLSSTYADHRPVMSPELARKIVEFLGDGTASVSNSASLMGKFDHAVDVGCGSGQSTRAFAPYFSKVTGIDVSSSQVATAEQVEIFENILYKVGAAEDLPFPSNSIDLINVSQAAHWFDFTKFFAEADRVLRPGGVISVNSYRIPHLYSLTDASISAKLTEVMENLRSKTLKAYWIRDRDNVDEFYADLMIPYKTCCTFRNDCSLSFKYEAGDIVPVSFVMGYITSLSAYQTYLKKSSDDGLLQRIQNKLLSIMGEEDPEEALVKVSFPVTLVMGKK